MRVTELADALQLHPSGTHRLLTSLVRLGYVEQDPVTEFYRLSLKLAAIGYLQASRVTDVCQPVVDRVATETAELVRLAVLSGNDLTTIAHAQGARGSLICQSRTFPTLPLHVTASGKAWLASLAQETALKLVIDAGFGRPGEFGPNAIHSVDALLAELAATQARGYGLAMEEAEPGVSSVSVLIRPDGDDPVGTIAVVSPASRMNADRVAEFARIAKTAATDLGMIWPLRRFGTSRGAVPDLVLEVGASRAAKRASAE
jgi:DNA-binding IclR family transcriptional regulator